MNKVDKAVGEGGDEMEEEKNASSSSVNEEGVFDPNERRDRRPPIWMKDYKSIEGLFEEEDVAN